jgi:nitrite reductase (NADH) large subunit
MQTPATNPTAPNPVGTAPTDRPHLLVIGNGMAGVRLLEALVRRAPDAYRITAVGAEPRPAYNRVLLSALLARDVGEDDIALKDAGWYAAHGIALVTGDAAVALDPTARTVTLASGRVLAYDACVLATGSDAVRLPLPGMDLPGVITFRDLADVAVMEAAIAAHGRVAVIGGGLLGIEAAYGFARRGVPVTLVHVLDRLMERQLDAPGAAVLARALRTRGIDLRLAHRTVAVTGESGTTATPQATGLAFADGETLVADLVVCAVGVRPNVALARTAGLAVGRGIVVDDHMAASAPGVFAIGECAEHRGTAYGLVEPAYAQADVLAARLTGDTVAAFAPMVLATNLKVSSVPVFSAGAIEAGDGSGQPGTTAAVVEDRRNGVYRKLVFRGDRLVGCVLVGAADDGLWLLDLIRSGAPVGAIRADLVHGRAFVATAEAA